MSYSGSFLFGPAFGSAPGASEDNTNAEYETEIIPVSAVIHLIDIHVIGKNRNDKGNW